MLKALVTIGAFQLFTMLVLLIRTKTLALLLGPELVGAMAVIDKLLAVIVQSVSLSLPFAALRFLPGRWAAAPGEYRALFERMRNLLVGLTVTATAVALGVTAIWPAVWGSELLPYRGALTAAILTMPVLGLVPFLQNAIAGRFEQNRSMIVGLLNATIAAVASAAVWWRGLVGYYLVYAALGLVLMTVVMHLATHEARGIPLPRTPQPRLAIGLPRQIWRFSAALLTLTFISPYAALFVQYHLLQDHGARAAGWMQAAFGIAVSVRTVLGTAHAVFLTPNVNRGGSIEERMTWANNFQSIFCLLAGIAVPPLLLFPDIAVRLLYSASFLPAAAVLAVFVGGEITTLIAGTYQSLTVAQDRMGVHVLITLGAQLLILGVAAALIQPLGLLGAGLAGLAGSVFLLGTTVMFLRRTYGLRIPGRVAIRCAWLILALMGSGTIGVFLHATFWPAVLTKAAAYLVVVVGFALLLSEEERTRLRHILAQWRLRFLGATS